MVIPRLTPAFRLAILALCVASSSCQTNPSSTAKRTPERIQSLPFDLAHVRGLEADQLPARTQRLLSQNGFVVYGPPIGDISSCYKDTRHKPPFVTVDSVIEIFLSDFEDAWGQLESRQAKRFFSMQEGLWNELVKRWSKLRNEASKEAGYRLLGLLAVGRKLSDPSWQPMSALPNGVGKTSFGKMVKEELGALSREKGFFDSPLWWRRLDLSKFRVTGSYAASEELRRYYLVSRWWGDQGLRSAEPQECLMVAILAWIIQGTSGPSDPKDWRQDLEAIERTYDRFFERSDDIAPDDLYGLNSLLSQTADSLGDGDISRKTAKWFSEQRSPVYFHEADPRDYERGLGKGFRLLPPRPTAESIILNRLTEARIGRRLLPRGLDILAAYGNERAYEETLQQEPEGSRREWLRQNLDRVRKEVRDIDDRHGPTYQVALRNLYRALADPAEDSRVQLFMSTDAYQDRGMAAALATWTGSREIYVVRTSYATVVAGISKIVGLAEPNLEAWQNLVELWHQAAAALSRNGVRLDHTSLGMALLFRRIAEKQLLGKPLTKGEESAFQLYDLAVENALRKSSQAGADGILPPDRRVCVPIAAATPPPQVRWGGKACAKILAIAEFDGELHAFYGGVLDYREFDLPMGRALNRNDFHKLMDSPKAPKPLPWMKSYRVGP